jgi:hypothetical protein
MNIFCVSPDYLKSIHKESKDYNFNLQGYGNLELGINGLMKTNISELYGFCYVAETLPSKVKLLKKFVELCDKISEHSSYKKRFVFCLKSDAGLSQLINLLQTSNIEIYLSRFEELTDMIIRREIFGTILESHLNPFSKRKYSELLFPSSFKTLRYVSIMPPRVLKALEPVRFRETLESTVIEDNFLSENRSNKDFLYLLRFYFIKSRFEGSSNIQMEIEEILKNTKDPYLKTSYELLYSYVKLRGIKEG